MMCYFETAMRKEYFISPNVCLQSWFCGIDGFETVKDCEICTQTNDFGRLVLLKLSRTSFSFWLIPQCRQPFPFNCKPCSPNSNYTSGPRLSSRNSVETGNKRVPPARTLFIPGTPQQGWHDNTCLPSLNNYFEPFRLWVQYPSPAFVTQVVL
jgi:hypothetical protein